MGGKDGKCVDRQTRDGCVGGRDGKWVDRDRLGMDGWVEEMASG